jgi:hypothetical protein
LLGLGERGFLVWVLGGEKIKYDAFIPFACLSCPIGWFIVFRASA